jgi:hypothetical protein
MKGRGWGTAKDVPQAGDDFLTVKVGEGTVQRETNRFQYQAGTF